MHLDKQHFGHQGANVQPASVHVPVLHISCHKISETKINSSFLLVQCTHTSPSLCALLPFVFVLLCVCMKQKGTCVTPSLCRVSESDAFVRPQGARNIIHRNSSWKETASTCYGREIWPVSETLQRNSVCFLRCFPYVTHFPCLYLLGSTDGGVMASQRSFVAAARESILWVKCSLAMGINN